MTVLIDPPTWPYRGTLFSHLASDTSIAALHVFARRVGLHPRAYDGDHYDVPDTRYAELVAAGAQPVGARELLAAITTAGLRFKKRRGERPLASVPDALVGLGVAHQLELVRSPLDTPAETTVAAAVIVTDTRRRVLLVRGDDGWRLPGAVTAPGVVPRARALDVVRALQAPGSGERVSAPPPVDVHTFGFARVRPRGAAPPGSPAPPGSSATTGPPPSPGSFGPPGPLAPPGAPIGPVAARGLGAGVGWPRHVAVFTAPGWGADATPTAPTVDVAACSDESDPLAAAVTPPGPWRDAVWHDAKELTRRVGAEPWWPLLARHLED